MAKAKNKRPSEDDFIKEYILTGCNNARQAAIAAGYSEKTADQAGSRMLKKVKVQLAIEEYKKVALNEFVYSKEKKLQLLQSVMIKCSKDDDEKGMINANSVIAAIKEHNLMQGDNAPTQVDNVSESITGITIEVVGAGKD
jgi:phage terminase small subunit